MGGQGFAVDASLISADVRKQNSGNPDRMADAKDAPRAVREYLDTLDDAALARPPRPNPSLRLMPIRPANGLSHAKAPLLCLFYQLSDRH